MSAHIDCLPVAIQKTKPRTRKLSGPCVYVVFDAHRPGVCKIGFSKNLSARLSQLRAGLKRSLYAKHVLYCRNMSTARSVESLMHRRVAEKRVDLGPEWFALSEGAAAQLVEWAALSHADVNTQGYTGCLAPEEY